MVKSQFSNVEFKKIAKISPIEQLYNSFNLFHHIAEKNFLNG